MYRYYEDKLSAERLKRVYEIAPPRVRQYLEAEIDHIVGIIREGDKVLELGCGYGRILPSLARKADLVVGIDTSFASLNLGAKDLAGISTCRLLCMDALHLAFEAGFFDCIACVQNGISAFHVDQKELVREGIRVAKPGGRVLFSTYSDRFWEHRLEWFRLQSEAELVGEIDWEKTGNGVIVCKDGFTGTIVRPEQFTSLTEGLDVEMHIAEVDQSSVFYEVIPRRAR